MSTADGQRLTAERSQDPAHISRMHGKEGDGTSEGRKETINRVRRKG